MCQGCGEYKYVLCSSYFVDTVYGPRNHALPAPYDRSMTEKYVESTHLIHTTTLVRQVSKVDQKSRMEAELSSFESQLQRAKLLQAARAQRLRAAAKATAAQPTQDIAEESKESLSAKQTLFPEETHETDDGREPTTHDEVSKVERRWTPQLDLSTPQLDLSRCQVGRFAFVSALKLTLLLQ